MGYILMHSSGLLFQMIISRAGWETKDKSKRELLNCRPMQGTLLESGYLAIFSSRSRSSVKPVIFFCDHFMMGGFALG